MAKFMFVYRDSENTPDLSPEEMQQAMTVWMDWIKSGMDAGWLLDGGDALTPEGRMVHSDNSVTDGPFAESKELVGGYSMVEASDFDAAVAIAKDSPMISVHKGTIEIRELAGVAKD